MTDYELMLRRKEEIKMISEFLRRPLFDYEEEYLWNNGMESFIKDFLGFDDLDANTYPVLIDSIIDYCTYPDYERFDKTLDDADDETLMHAEDTLKTIINAIEDTLAKRLEKSAKAFEGVEESAPKEPEPDHKTYTELMEHVLGCSMEDFCRDLFNVKKSEHVVKDADKPKTVKEPLNFDKIVEELKQGKSIKMSQEDVDKTFNYLWDNFDKINISVKNGEISAKF